jgi:hypothetical protein
MHTNQSVLAAVIPVALSTMGCAGNVDLGDGQRVESAENGISFATEQDAWRQVAERATAVGMEAREHKDAEGNLIGVSGLSIGSSEEVQEKQAQLLSALGGSDRTVRIAGKTYSLRSEADSEIGLKAQALCSGELCTSHESFRQNRSRATLNASRSAAETCPMSDSRSKHKDTRGTAACSRLPLWPATRRPAIEAWRCASGR